MVKGYWNKPEATAEAFRAGWFHTGDVGYLDEDGYLYIQDRVKDMIISGGENIYPAELENVLAGCPEVQEAAVIGVPDERWGERPLAIIVPRAGAEQRITAEVLRAHLQASVDDGTLVSWAVPDQYLFIHELPRTSVGKIDKKALREAVFEQRWLSGEELLAALDPAALAKKTALAGLEQSLASDPLAPFWPLKRWRPRKVRTGDFMTLFPWTL